MILKIINLRKKLKSEIDNYEILLMNEKYKG